MAISRRSRPFPSSLLFSRLQTLFQRWAHTSAGEGEAAPLPCDSPPLKYLPDGRIPWLLNAADLLDERLLMLTLRDIDQSDTSIWKTLDSNKIGIDKSAISSPTWMVLNFLRKKGFDAYLVGGCVRDLLLKRTPKDFDIITTASLKKVKKMFGRSRVVGRQFPICHVQIGRSIIEVSSFMTTHMLARERQTSLFSQIPTNCDKKDVVRWENSMGRDFTINGLFFDPSVNTIYDYVDGIRDLRTSKVRTVIPAHISFKEDCARILRGLRIAARLGLRFSKETAAAMQDLSSSIMTLNKARLMMELNFMLAYGAAESSIRLLHKFKLLEILLPVHAAYLDDQSENQFGQSSSMLMKLLSNVDKLLAADRPCDCRLWLGLLAFHIALLHHPQDALVVLTFSSILYHGTWSEALKFVRENARTHVQFVPEVSAASGIKSDESLLEEASHLASLVKSSLRAFSSTDALGLLPARYTKTSSSFGLVLISEKMEKSVGKLFGVLETDITSYVSERNRYDIDYQRLKKGDLDETRFVLGKIIMDTLNGGIINVQNQDLVPVKKRPLLSALFK